MYIHTYRAIKYYFVSMERVCGWEEPTYLCLHNTHLMIQQVNGFAIVTRVSWILLLQKISLFLQ